MENQSVWSVVVAYLRAIGTRAIFGLPSDDLGVVRALQDGGSEPRLIVGKDQRNAVFMAAGYALASGQIGVCTVGKGPALTNAVTGLLESASLSAPVLLIGVGTGRDRLGTQAFQEADQMAVVRPVVKWAYRVESEKRLQWALEKAAFLAINGNPGPVYVEIPEDLAEAPGPATAISPPRVLRANPASTDLDAAFRVLEGARRPLVLLGGGARSGAAEPSFMRLAELTGAAVFVTASGRSAVDEGHPQFCGVSGLYTAEPLRDLWRDADVVTVLGSKMEETATLLFPPSSASERIIQVNSHLEHLAHGHNGLKLWGDCREAARYWAAEFEKGKVRGRNAEWVERVARLKQNSYDQKAERLRQLTAGRAVHVADILAAIEQTLPSDGVLVQENGLVDMWSYFYPYFSFKRDQTSIVPSEQTSLGFGAAAAVGVRLAKPESVVVALVGDGAFNLFSPDLATAVENNLAVTYVILNNRSFGWLEYQWRSQGLGTASDPRSPFRFALNTEIVHKQVVRMDVRTREGVAESLEKAYRLNAEGKTVLMDVAIDGFESAPGVDHFYAAHPS